MRGICIILLLVATLFVADTDAWRVFKKIGRAFRRAVRNAKRVATFIKDNPQVIKAAIALAGRDIHALDANKDGTIDQSEAEAFTGEERAARDLLALADEDDDSIVSTEEFKRRVREIEEMELDELEVFPQQADAFGN